MATNNNDMESTTTQDVPIKCALSIVFGVLEKDEPKSATGGYNDGDVYHDAVSKIDVNTEPKSTSAAVGIGKYVPQSRDSENSELIVLMPPALSSSTNTRSDMPAKTASATVNVALMSHENAPTPKDRPLSAPVVPQSESPAKLSKTNNPGQAAIKKPLAALNNNGVFNDKVIGTSASKRLTNNASPKPCSRTPTTNVSITQKNNTAAASVSVVSSSRPTSTPSTASQGVLPVVRKQQAPFQYEKYKQYKKLAENAYIQRKIFSIIGGYQSVRRALLRRGWQERLLDTQYRNLQSISHHSLLQRAQPGNEYEKMAISKLLQPYPSYFLWYPRYTVMTRFDHVVPFKSRLTRARDHDFTLKDGLISCDHDRHWQYIPNRSELRCPRSYRLYSPDETEDFMKDYRFTGCTSLLAFLVSGAHDNGTNEFFATNNTSAGTVSHKSIEFALRRIRENLRCAQHDDIEPNFVQDALESVHWRDFFKDFHAVVRCGSRYCVMPGAELTRRHLEWKSLLQTCRKAWPTMETDGFMNIWIMKPAGNSCGVGVTVMQDNLRIVETASKNKQKRYLVQKYLERPLLIYKTKFDIRQYFLMVGRGNSIQVWMYKACYLKFSSQEFSLRNFHESVHLTNHTVQKNYTNAANRSALLPTCNMWSSLQFQNYLETIGEKDKWASRIYPGMKRNVVAAVRSAYEENGELERNCFELVGGDFMVTDNFDVQLLEVNATPDMYPSTPVTRQICADCLEDVVKVVVDRFNDPHAPTGYFELIYEIPMQRGVMHSNLSAQGKLKPLHVAPKQSSATQRNVMNRQRSVSVLEQKQFIPETNVTTMPNQRSVGPSAIDKSTPSKQQQQQRQRQHVSSDTQQSQQTLATKWRTNSKQILDDLAGRLLKNTATSTKTHIQTINREQQKQQQGLSREVDRLMQLNQTIERLLNSRSRSSKIRQNIVNQFLAARQSQSLC